MHLRPTDLLRQRPQHRRCLIITAVPLEMRAVRAHLSNSVAVIGKQNTIYECGDFTVGSSTWIVIVAQVGAGNHEAHSVVSNASMEFDDLELVMFAGIAGSRKKDIPIGSVIASAKVYNAYAGKYDADGFQGRPAVVNADHSLVQAALKVERDAEWQIRIRAGLRMEMPDDADYPKPRPPDAFIGPIVATEAVVASAEADLEALIARHYGDAYGIEMEGYGTAFAAERAGIPWIVVRGVSDMAKDKTPEKDKFHQPVAAMHASAFAFELLALWGSLPTKRPPNSWIAMSPSAAPDADHLTGQSRPTRGGASPVRTLSFTLKISGHVDQTSLNSMLLVIQRLSGDEQARLGPPDHRGFAQIDATTSDLLSLKFDELAGAVRDESGLTIHGLAEAGEIPQLEAQIRAMTNASEDLAKWPKRLPDGTSIERPELDQLVARLSETSSTTILLGAPGAGKSALLSALTILCESQSVPVLAIKADLLPASITSEVELFRNLGLPDPVDQVVASVARLGSVVLLIDQLDALAAYVDLRTARLNILLNVIRRLSGMRNVHIVLSARTFEYEHDVRLKSVEAETVVLQLPPWHSILSVLQHRGIHAEGWPIDAQEVLRSPQALSIFLRMDASEPYASYQAMLDQLWSERILKSDGGVELSRTATRIANEMAEEEVLWLPIARFDDVHADVEALVALDILTLSAAGNSIGFSHQTLFEQTLARSFARGRGSLSAYVFSRQESLFIRPKVWAGLNYLRAVEPSIYGAELTSLWKAQGLRRHLRVLLVEFMGQQSSPLDSEIVLLADEFASPDGRQLAFRAITGSPGWFSRMRGAAIEPSMHLPPNEVHILVPVLGAALLFARDEALDLIAENWISNDDYHVWAWLALEQLSNWDSKAVGIAGQILLRPHVALSRVSYLVGAIGAKDPISAIGLMRVALDCAVDRVKAEFRDAQISKSTFVDRLTALAEDHSNWDTAEALAQAVPKLFLHQIWPWFVQVLSHLREEEDSDSLNRFSVTYRLGFRFDSKGDVEEDSQLMAGIRAAVTSIAREDTAFFVDWLDSNEAIDAVPAQALFAYALASNPVEFAARAFEFLTRDSRRLVLGDYSDRSLVTKHLIAAASPYWSAAQISDFQQRIRTYRFEIPSDLLPTERRSTLRFHRLRKLELLRALPQDRLPKEATALIAEETRLFGVSRATPRSETFWVGPVMSAEDMSKASNADILNAFRILPDATAWDHPKDYRRGGNIQLSRAFAEFAKSHVERALQIISSLDPYGGSRAAGYALEALAELMEPSAFEGTLLSLVARDFHSVEFRHAASHAVGRLLNRDWHVSLDVLAVIESWIAESASTDPDSDDEKEDEKDDDSKHEGQSVLWDRGGISFLPSGNYPMLHVVVRGYMALKDDERALSVLQAHLKRLETSAVWTALLPLIEYVRPPDKTTRVEFLEQLFAKYPGIVQTRDAVLLMTSARWWALDLSEVVAEQWHDSNRRWVRQAYGEFIALVAITQAEARWAQTALDTVVASQNEAHRVGVAHAAAHLWTYPKHRQDAADILMSLMPNAHAEEWGAIFELFATVDELVPDSLTQRVLARITESISEPPKSASTFFVERLQALLPHLAEDVAKMALKLVQIWGKDLGNISTAVSAQAPQFVDLAITLHRLGSKTREFGTLLFEKLLDIGAYGAQQTLNEIDNRFVPLGSARPARLRGRARRGRGRRSRS